ncbi:POGO family transposase, putative [Ixodes scapularis]|uniref:POGO family transposase, putative n=1 Tax=Ixodes scapularis TaxID=6945 RepID=B7PGG5_IXOSC|nr:POGO family transposase, putative [Ixodes scapularis]|eukprot:XP_002434287.1 POGO family transposase, putative [Ixodes scapularis]
MDQTMVRMDTPATRTNNLVNESSIRITNTGCARWGFTVALCATAAGIKLPAFVVLKAPTGRIPPRAYCALKIPANVRVTCSKNGWMTSPLLAQWVTRVWGPNRDDVRRLLALDQAPIHKTEAAQKAFSEVDTDVVLIPGGCTSILQPADVSWIKPFKDHLRGIWAKFMSVGATTPKGNLKKPSRQDVITFVAEAWATVSEETVYLSFKRCGLSTALDGSEDSDPRAWDLPDAIRPLPEVGMGPHLVEEAGHVQQKRPANHPTRNVIGYDYAVRLNSYQQSWLTNIGIANGAFHSSNASVSLHPQLMQAVCPLPPLPFFTKVNLRDAFYHFGLAESAHHLTSYPLDGQYFQYTVLPFGDRQAPFFMQSLATPWFGRLMPRGCGLGPTWTIFFLHILILLFW